MTGAFTTLTVPACPLKRSFMTSAVWFTVVVWHTDWRPGQIMSEPMFRQPSQLADIAGRLGVPHFLFISSLNTVPRAARLPDSDASLYPQPDDGYAASKWQSEIALKAICQGHEQALTIIRPALIYDQELTANLARVSRLMRWWPAALPAVGNRCLISRPDLIELIVGRALQSLPESSHQRCWLPPTGSNTMRRVSLRHCLPADAGE